MATDPTWDLLVVGGGTAGIVGAKTAAGLGARVVLRACPSRRRLPLDRLRAQQVAPGGRLRRRARPPGRQLRSGRRRGLGGLRAVMEHVHGAIDTIAPVDSPQALREAGVVVVQGEARFTSPFTDPEVAAVGAPTWADGGPEPDVVTREHADVDRAVTERATAGFSRLALGRRHRIVGATVVGPRAGEALAELTLAIREGLTTGDVSGAIHAYPTYADGPWNAAIGDVQARLQQPAVRGLTRTVTTGRRLWSRWRP